MAAQERPSLAELRTRKKDFQYLMLASTLNHTFAGSQPAPGVAGRLGAQVQHIQ